MNLTVVLYGPGSQPAKLHNPGLKVKQSTCVFLEISENKNGCGNNSRLMEQLDTVAEITDNNIIMTSFENASSHHMSGIEVHDK